MASSSSLPQPSETTPLLIGTDDNGAIARSQQSPDHRDDPSAEADGASHRLPLSRTHRALFFMNATMVFLTLSHAIYLGVLIGLNSYSSSHFGKADYDFYDSGIISIVLVDVFIALFGLFNVLRIKTRGSPGPSGINIIIYGCYTFLLFALVAQETSNRLYWNVISCDRSLDDPHSWYPGSYAECRAWVKRYTVIAWVFIVFEALVACLSFAITTLFFVKVFQERSQDTSNSGFAFRIPAGQVSLNVSLQWGSIGQTNEPARVAEIPAQEEAPRAE